MANDRRMSTNVSQYQTVRTGEGGKETRHAPEWMNPTLKNKARVIYWDFETIGLGSGEKYAEGAGFKNNAGQISLQQDPYELGMSIYSHNTDPLLDENDEQVVVDGVPQIIGGQWVHKSFMFSPVGAAPNMTENVRKQKEAGTFNAEAWIQFNSRFLREGGPKPKDTDAAVKEKAAGSVQSKNKPLYKKIMGMVGNMFNRSDHEDEAKRPTPVNWGKKNAKGVYDDIESINGWLTHHGYDSNGKGGDADPHFITHNGINFDNPIMTRLLKESGNHGMFGDLFNKAMEDHPARKADQPIYDENGKRTGTLYSKDQDHNMTWLQDTPRHHDSAFIFTQMYGATGRRMIDYVSDVQTPSLEGNAPMHGGGRQGTAMDKYRASRLDAYHPKSNDPFLKIIHGNATIRDNLMRDLGVLDIVGVPSTNATTTPEEYKKYYAKVLDALAHTGSGDTAVSTLSLLPMFVGDIERDWDKIEMFPESPESQQLEEDLRVDGIWYDGETKKRVATLGGEEYIDDKGKTQVTRSYRDIHALDVPETIVEQAEQAQMNLGVNPTKKAKKAAAVKLDKKKGNDFGQMTLRLWDEANPTDPQAIERARKRDAENEGETDEQKTTRLQTERDAKDAHIAATSAEGPYEEDATSAQSRIESKLTSADFPLEMRKLMGDGEIDVLRWRGGDTTSKTKGRTVVILPLGNTRVAFYGSYKNSKGEGTEEVQSWVPILGAGKTTPFQGSGAMDIDAMNETRRIKNDEISAAAEEAGEVPTLLPLHEETDIWTGGITAHLRPLFSPGRGPLSEIRKLVNSTLISPDIADKMADHTAGFPEIEHMALNKRINTNASLGIISESLGKAVSCGDISPELIGREYGEVQREIEGRIFDATNPVITGWEGGETEGEELPLNSSHQMVSLLLDDPMNSKEALEALNMLDPATGKIKASWYSTTKDEQLPEQLATIRTAMQEVLDANLDISHTDMDADMFEFDAEKGTLAVDFNRLISGYLGGDMPEGVHPKVFSRGPIDGTHDHVEFGDQIANYLILKHGMDNLGNNAETMMGMLKYTDPMGVDDHSLYHNMSTLRQQASNGDRRAIIELGKHTSISNEEAVMRAYSSSANTAESDGRNPNAGKDEPTSTDEQVAQVEEYTKLFGSPYTAYHGIHGPEAEYMAAETMEELFPPRDKATTQIEVAKLVDDALEEWEEDPTTLLRELEWIRENHPEYIDDDKMRTALQDEDRKSFVGKWIDAVKIASDSGADFELVEAEKVGMKQDGDNKFMSNSHRELLRQADAKTPLVKNPPFEMPKAKKELSLGDKARQLAEGQWKKSGYYNVWRQLRNIKRDNVGRKALEAAKKGDVGAIRDLGITNTTQFMEHIGDLPVEGAAQRGLLGTLWEGKKTFRQLHEERNKPNQQQRVATSMQQLDALRNRAIQSRVPDTTVTNAQRKAAAKNAQISFDAQAGFNDRVRAQMEADQSAPGVRTSGGTYSTATGQTSGKARFSGGASGMQDHVDGTTKPSQAGMDGASKVDTNVDNLSKSMQVLKEYLRSV